MDLRSSALAFFSFLAFLSRRSWDLAPFSWMFSLCSFLAAMAFCLRMCLLIAASMHFSTRRSFLYSFTLRFFCFLALADLSAAARLRLATLCPLSMALRRASRARLAALRYLAYLSRFLRAAWALFFAAACLARRSAAFLLRSAARARARANLCAARRAARFLAA